MICFAQGVFAPGMESFLAKDRFIDLSSAHNVAYGWKRGRMESCGRETRHIVKHVEIKKGAFRLPGA
jgi:hypothetical protein